MVLYLLIIGFSTIICLISEKFHKRNEFFLSITFSIFSLLILSVFSGTRNLQVGIDITTYGKNIFESVVIYGPKVAINYYSRWADVGYIYLNYLISFFTKNIYVFLGLSTFIAQLNFLMFFRKYRSELNPAIALGIFNIVTFAYSFSILRQILAMAFLIWCYYFLIKKNILFSLLFAIIASLFHKSAILIVVIIFIAYFLALIKEKINQKYLLFIMIIFTATFSILIVRYPNIIYALIGDLNVSNIQLQNYGSPARFLLFLIPIFLLKIKLKERFIQSNEDYLLYFICLIVISFGWLGGINYSVTRLTYFLIPFYITFVTKKMKLCNSRTIYSFVIIWSILLFWWLIVRGNEGGVIPYVPFWENYLY